MAIRLTKKNEDEDKKDKTVQASEFINRLTSLKERRSTKEEPDIPWTEIKK